MPTVPLLSVLIWYAETHLGIEARVRTYAGEYALREESVLLDPQRVLAQAQAQRRLTWDETDICALLPQPGAVWILSAAGLALTTDIREP